MIKSRNDMVTRSITHLATDALPVIEIESTFSLLQYLWVEIYCHYPAIVIVINVEILILEVFMNNPNLIFLTILYKIGIEVSAKNKITSSGN